MSDILDTRFENKKIELNANFAKVGEEINITAKDPTMKKVLIGAGWDLNTFDADALDLDLSAFLIGKDEMTRVNEDFVFYNQPETLGGAVKHMGDSRTGAGDGDDEVMIIDLHGVPFDVMKIAFVLSIYRGEEKQQRVAQLQNAYLRLVNHETAIEITRFPLPDLENRNETALIMAMLTREGPKWHFQAIAEPVEGGLGAVAQRYGCVITQS
jgi:tellurium resistance protein TerD